MTTIPFDDLKLVELVRQNKHLYDKQCSEYRDLLKKDITWKAIAAALGTSADICRKRFRCLRDRFNKEKKSRKKEMLEATSLPLVFKKMMFLWDHLSHRNYYSSRGPFGTDDQTSGSSIQLQDWPDSETQNMFDLQVQKLSEMEDKESSDIQTQIQIVGETVRMCYEAEVKNVCKSPSGNGRVKKMRKLRPKLDSSHQPSKKFKTDPEPHSEPDLRHKPVIVTLEWKENGSQNVQMITSREPTANEDCNPRSVPLSLAQESAVKSDCDRQNTRVDAVEGERGPEIPSSRLSCNEAFCLMLKDYLDHVTHPLKLSLLRIKILTILHNELYG